LFIYEYDFERIDIICCRLVRRCLILYLVAVFVWFRLKDQLQSIQSMIWTSTLQIRKHEYSGDLDFIILFVDIFAVVCY